jgi:hypothetical protein
MQITRSVIASTDSELNNYNRGGPGGFDLLGWPSSPQAESNLPVPKLDAEGSFFALRLLADGSDLKSSQDWVRFAKNVAGSHRLCFGDFHPSAPSILAHQLP